MRFVLPFIKVLKISKTMKTNTKTAAQDKLHLLLSFSSLETKTLSLGTTCLFSSSMYCMFIIIIPSFDMSFSALYTETKKDTSLMSVTLPNANRFSKFLH